MDNTSIPAINPIPPEIRGWNWGAFWLNWIWGIANQTYIALLFFIPFINFIMIFVLGAKGNEWAWQNRQWESVEQFRAVQKNWATCGWILFIITVIISILFFIAAAMLLSEMQF